MNNSFVVLYYDPNKTNMEDVVQQHEEISKTLDCEVLTIPYGMSISALDEQQLKTLHKYVQKILRRYSREDTPL